MCGIIGYISTKDNTQEVLVSKLKKLEYRGYDSSGLCLNLGNEFYIQKSLGQIFNLEKILTKKPANCGIAHTRWATHGKVTNHNTHPHASQNGNWCLVHNGIIENHLILKKDLLNAGINFYGETDTEVIPNLLETIKGTSLKKIQTTTKHLEGSFALAILNKNEPNTMYLVRKNSPLFVAQNSYSVMASSDPICFSEDYLDYYVLPNDCICQIKNNKITFYDFNLTKINISTTKIGVFEKSAELGKYSYFAEKEINEIPHVLQNIISAYSNTQYFSKINKEYLKNINKIKLIGCGTAYHACLMGAKYIEQQTQIECNAYIASEFRYSNPLIDTNTLCIFTSQSGETADTLLCLELAKKMGAKTISLVNVPYSSIARQTDIVLPVCAGMEIAVMSTKAYNAMLFVYYLLSRHMHNVLFNTNNNYLNELKNLTNVNFFKNHDMLDNYSSMIINCSKIFFIGKGEDYITSLEAGLKLKEITYINCVSLPSGELKHGTLSLVDNNSLVFVLASKSETLSKNLASASEVKSRGGKIVLITNLDLNQEDRKDIDYIFKFDNTQEEFSSMLSVIPFQTLAYKTCLNLNLNPDKPRNLAKSVTVE